MLIYVTRDIVRFLRVNLFASLLARNFNISCSSVCERLVCGAERAGKMFKVVRID